MKALKLKLLILALSTVILASCSSTGGSGSYDKVTGKGLYGTGPNYTKPMPQDEPVNLNNVPGATVKYEPLSRGGNKDYTLWGQSYRVWRDCHSYQETGTASWYGPGFHGEKTSNGETYNQRGFSAAHKNLPLPSFLKVTNLENGKAVVVRVNDRGPFHGNRIIDLSEGAAKAIDMTKKGTAKVKLEYIDVRSDNKIANLSNSILSGNSSYGSGSDSIKTLANDLKNGNKPSISTTIGAAVAVSKAVDKITDNLDSKESNIKTYKKEDDLIDVPSSNITYKSVDIEKVEDNILNNSANSVNSNKTTSTNGKIYIQFFSTSSKDKANTLQQDIATKLGYPVVVSNENNIYRLKIGPLAESNINDALNKIKGYGFNDSFVKRI